MKKVLILLLWLLPSCSVVIFAQTQRIAGTVVVGDGQPAVGAAIVVKGTNIGAVTNVDGKFVIAEAPASAQRLVVYHVGMERKEVDVAPNVYIQLQPVEQGFSWNVKAGVSLFSYRRPDGLDERTGFSVGAGVEYNFSRHWAIQRSNCRIRRLLSTIFVYRSHLLQSQDISDLPGYPHPGSF